MEKLPKVAVIMSTYNGEKYLKDQIDSILAQKDIDLTLHIFDDCSKDNTVSIIKDYQLKHKNINLTINEKNKNFTYNFLDGLFSFKDNNEYDYYAFADQDDFWVDDKLISAINKINEKGQCTLYCSNLKIVNENLQYGNNDMMPKNHVNKHYDVICKNIVTGCTIVMDNDFKNFATRFYPENIYLHDYWLALIANYCSGTNFIFDPNPEHILYRQHGKNLIGENKGNIFKRFWKLYFKKIEYNKTTRNLIKTFNNMYGELIYEQDREIFNMLSEVDKFKNRFKLFFKVKCNFSTIFKIKMLLNKY